MPHLIIFDIDGTLTQTNDVDDRLFLQAMTEYLGTSIDTDWTHYRNVTDSGIAEELFEKYQRLKSEIEIVKKRFVSLVKELLVTEPDCCREVCGANDFLNQLCARSDIALGIATGGWSESAYVKLRHVGIDTTNMAFASAEDSISRAEIMTICAQKAVLMANIEKFDSITYFGDGVWDVKASTALGWNFIGIGEGTGAERLRAAGAECLFKDYSGSNKSLMLQAVGIDSQ